MLNQFLSSELLVCNAWHFEPKVQNYYSSVTQDNKFSTLSLLVIFIHSTFCTSGCLKLSLSISAFKSSICLGTWTKPHAPQHGQVVFSLTLATHVRSRQARHNQVLLHYSYQVRFLPFCIFIDLAVRVFANGLGDRGSVLGWVIQKTQKMALDPSLLNTQNYKVRIKGKVEQSRERSSALLYTSVRQLLKREPSRHPRLRSATILFLLVHGTSSVLFHLWILVSSFF